MSREVVVIIPALRADELLRCTLRSVAAQDLPPGVDLETVIAVAEMPTETMAIEGLRVRFIHNPGGSIPAGLNIAIASSRGEVVVRVDSRCTLPQEYVATLLTWLEDDRVGCVGGAQLVTDDGLVGSTYATAFNSPLLGLSAYRYSRRSGDTDSPYLGAWTRPVLQELRGFDERLLRNQDNEIATRVRASGRRVVYDARLVVGYVAGRSLLQLVRHHREFGLWRARQAAYGQQSLSRKQVAVVVGAATATLLGAGTLAWHRTRPVATVALLLIYAAAAVISGRCASSLRRARPDLTLRRLDPLSVMLAPALAAVLNVAWLSGLVAGHAHARTHTVRRRST